MTPASRRLTPEFQELTRIKIASDDRLASASAALPGPTAAFNEADTLVKARARVRNGFDDDVAVLRRKTRAPAAGNPASAILAPPYRLKNIWKDPKSAALFAVQVGLKAFEGTGVWCITMASTELMPTPERWFLAGAGLGLATLPYILEKVRKFGDAPSNLETLAVQRVPLLDEVDKEVVRLGASQVAQYHVDMVAGAVNIALGNALMLVNVAGGVHANLRWPLLGATAGLSSLFYFGIVQGGGDSVDALAAKWNPAWNETTGEMGNPQAFLLRAPVGAQGPANQFHFDLASENEGVTEASRKKLELASNLEYCVASMSLWSSAMAATAFGIGMGMGKRRDDFSSYATQRVIPAAINFALASKHVRSFGEHIMRSHLSNAFINGCISRAQRITARQNLDDPNGPAKNLEAAETSLADARHARTAARIALALVNQEHKEATDENIRARTALRRFELGDDEAGPSNSNEAGPSNSNEAGPSNSNEAAPSSGTTTRRRSFFTSSATHAANYASSADEAEAQRRGA